MDLLEAEMMTGNVNPFPSVVLDWKGTETAQNCV
jgi:hypothetical protein